jgi:hypothetical protein
VNFRPSLSAKARHDAIYKVTMPYRRNNPAACGAGEYTCQMTVANEPRNPAMPESISQIVKEMRDAAGDFDPWGRDVIEAFAERLAAISAPVQASEARGDDRKDAALTRSEVPAYKVGDRVIWQNVYATVFDARIIEHTFRLKLEDGCTVHASESEIIPAPPTDSRGAL